MEKRNKYLESDGLYWESKSHEWFNDKNSTQYATKESVSLRGVGNKDGLKVICFVTRDKQSGEYDRVMMDVKTNEIVYDTKSLEDMGFEIDKMKTMIRFKV